MNSDALLLTAILLGSAAFTGALAYALADRELHRSGRASVALISAVLVGATSLFVPYLPVFAFLATAAAYLVMRRLVRPERALAASAVVLLGGLSCSVLIMSAALESM